MLCYHKLDNASMRLGKSKFFQKKYCNPRPSNDSPLKGLETAELLADLTLIYTQQFMCKALNLEIFQNVPTWNKTSEPKLS